MRFTLDRESLLVKVDGGMALADVEASLVELGLTLDVTGALAVTQCVAAWLAEGARGSRDPWLDPVDHLIAGCELILRDGRRFEIRPAPRRAVGPDLIALVVGMGERFARVESAWLRVHPIGLKRPNQGALAGELDPEISEGEAGLLDAIAARLDPSYRRPASEE
jgi:alkyldihydroxyacetonephosphate synthase